MNENEFADRFAALAPGETFVYFEGDLGAAAHSDRDVKALQMIAARYGFPKDVSLPTRNPNVKKAKYGKGLGFLTQRRLGAYRYAYRITKARQR